MNWRGLRFRIAFGLAGVLAVLFAILGGGLYLSRSRVLLGDTDVALKGRADWIEGIARGPAEAGDFSSFQEEMKEHTDLGREGRVVQILSESGRVLFRSENLAGASLPFTQTELAGLRPCQWAIRTVSLAGEGRLRLITQNGREKEGEGAAYFVQVAMPLDQVEANLRRLLRTLAGAIPLGAFLIGAGGWFLVGRTLKPVGDIVRSARLIRVDDLKRRLEIPKTGDEIEELSRILNSMLGELELNFERMRRFIADAAHEIRTPLGILLGETDVALQADRQSEEYRSILESNRKEVARLAGLVERLLFLSHMDAGQWRWEMRPVSLRPLLSDLAEKAGLLANDKDLRVILEADQEAVIRGDEMRLRQLLLNLVDNAVKHSRPGGRIILSLSRRDGQAVLGVEDEGAGIRPEDLPRIFDRFYRADKARERSRGGYGLGLSISQAIAQAHRGRIEVRSKVGEGSLFALWLPLP